VTGGHGNAAVMAADRPPHDRRSCRWRRRHPPGR
jgi:hypothetical protein